MKSPPAACEQDDTPGRVACGPGGKAGSACGSHPPAPPHPRLKEHHVAQPTRKGHLADPHPFRMEVLRKLGRGLPRPDGRGPWAPPPLRPAPGRGPTPGTPASGHWRSRRRGEARKGAKGMRSARPHPAPADKPPGASYQEAASTDSGTSLPRPGRRSQRTRRKHGPLAAPAPHS